MKDLFSPEQWTYVVIVIVILAGGLCAFGYACLRLLRMQRPGYKKQACQKQRNTSSQKG